MRYFYDRLVFKKIRNFIFKIISMDMEQKGNT